MAVSVSSYRFSPELKNHLWLEAVDILSPESGAPRAAEAEVRIWDG